MFSTKKRIAVTLKEGRSLEVKSMKKVISILACALILALTVTAFADTHVLPGTIVMYVARDEIKA